MYLLKIKGVAGIPDYAQLRDDNFTLLAYFRTDRPEKALIKAGFETQLQKITEFLGTMPFGKVMKVDL
jgi:hypothetical protein